MGLALARLTMISNHRHPLLSDAEKHLSVVWIGILEQNVVGRAPSPVVPLFGSQWFRGW